MTVIIKIFALVLILAGILFMVSPDTVFMYLENNKTSTVLYITAIVIRLIIGLALIKSAASTKHPGVIKVLGFVFVIAAIALLVIGHAQFQHLIETFIPLFDPYGLVTGIIVVAFGGYLLYAYNAFAKN